MAVSGSDPGRSSQRATPGERILFYLLHRHPLLTGQEAPLTHHPSTQLPAELSSDLGDPNPLIGFISLPASLPQRSWGEEVKFMIWMLRGQSLQEKTPSYNWQPGVGEVQSEGGISCCGRQTQNLERSPPVQRCQRSRFPTPEVRLPWLLPQTLPWGILRHPKLHLLSHLLPHPGWLGFLNEVSVAWMVALSEVHMWRW